MRWLVVTISLLFLAGIFLSELPIIVYYFYPQTAELEYNLFLSGKYDQKMTVLWYMYELAELINRMIWAYAFCKVSSIISYKLFKIGMVFIFYNFIQVLFYLWNRNSSGISNLLACICIVVVLYFLIKPDKNKSRYKSIE